MVRRKGGSLDCSYHWDRSSRSGASGNLRKSLNYLFVGIVNISFGLDAHLNLPGWCVHFTCCIRTGCEHSLALSRWCHPATCRPVDVRCPRSGLGELASGIYCASNVPDSSLLLQIWRKDTDEPEVSVEALMIWVMISGSYSFWMYMMIRYTGTCYAG